MEVPTFIKPFSPRYRRCLKHNLWYDSSKKGGVVNGVQIWLDSCPMCASED